MPFEGGKAVILMIEAEDVLDARLDVSTTGRAADDNKLVAETTSMVEALDTVVVGGNAVGAGMLVVAPHGG